MITSCLKRSNSVCNPFKKVCLSPGFGLTAFYSESDDDGDEEDCEENYSNDQKRARKRAYSLKSNRSLSFVDDKLNNAISKYSDDEEEAKSCSSPKAGLFQDKTIRKTSSAGDQIARNRCFEYLVGAIDEAWARYCDATSYAEDEVFNKNSDYLPNTPASIAFSEPDDDDDEGYKSASTNITEYDSEVDKKISTQPSSLRLQHLKDRLLKAKYYLQDYVDSFEEDDCISFWRRWDLIKYATIELVEDDDDDEVIESTIEELEKGRLYGCE